MAAYIILLSNNFNWCSQKSPPSRSLYTQTFPCRKSFISLSSEGSTMLVNRKTEPGIRCCSETFCSGSRTLLCVPPQSTLKRPGKPSFPDNAQGCPESKKWLQNLFLFTLANPWFKKRILQTTCRTRCFKITTVDGRRWFFIWPSYIHNEDDHC